MFRKNERETLNIALNLEMFLGDFLLLDVYCFWTSKQLLNDNSYYLTAYPGFMHHLMWQHWNLQNHSASMNLPCLCGPELSGYTPGTAQTIWIWGQSEQAVLFLILFKKAKKKQLLISGNLTRLLWAFNILSTAVYFRIGTWSCFWKCIWTIFKEMWKGW